MAQMHLAYLVTVAITFIIINITFLNSAFFPNRLFNLIIYTVSLLFIYRLSKQYFTDKKINPKNKAVLITGCDSGFGKLLAKRLDSEDFHVFASCVFPEGDGANELKQSCSNRLQVLPLDVTSDKNVTNALEFVKENLGSDVLWAVVNNAGVAKGSSVDFSTIKHFKDTIDVNALGPVRVSKAFLPLLKKSKGRIVNVCSLSSRIPTPYMCPYTMSKYAAVAFSECLSLEMGVWGVRVISIEPETFRTSITDTNAIISRIKAEMGEIDQTIISSYGEKYLEKMGKTIAVWTNWSSDNIDIVVDAMESAITEEHPNLVYKPRWSWYTKVMCSVQENASFSLYQKGFLIISKLLQYPVPRDAEM